MLIPDADPGAGRLRPERRNGRFSGGSEFTGVARVRCNGVRRFAWGYMLGKISRFFPRRVLGLPDAEPRRAVHIRKSGKCQRCAWRLLLASPSPNSEGVSEDCSAASPVAGVVPIVRRMPVRGRQVADQLIQEL